MKKIHFIIFIMLTVLLGGYFIFTSSENVTKNTEHMHEQAVEGYWTCSMHPEIKMEKSGKCPICGMELIYAEVSEDFDIEESNTMQKEMWHCESDPSVTSMKADICPLDGTPMIKMNMIPSVGEVVAKVKLKKSQIGHFIASVFPVQKMKMSKNLRVLGSVVQSEEKESNIPARIGGRVEKVYIQSTGSFISKGDPVVKLYSPELISAGEEYIVTRENYSKTKNSEYKILYKQAEEKLRLWDIQDWQIKSWYKKKNMPRNVTIYSPVSGIVTQRNVVVGDYLKTGESFYDLVDLSKVWVEMDVYEQDASLVRLGQKVIMKFSSYPGDEWSSEIDFVSPVLNEKTRTLNMRTTISNMDGKLKPGMVGEGHISVHLKGEPLVIPRTAIIDTGMRKVVWVSLGDEKYIARTIRTGFESEGYVEIKDGLKENEKVVIEGNFLLDAQAQLFGGYEDAKKVSSSNPHLNH